MRFPNLTAKRPQNGSQRPTAASVGDARMGGKPPIPRVLSGLLPLAVL